VRERHGTEVFLTGGTGFVGSHVLRALLDAGYTVRALVRPGARPLPILPGLKPIEGDLLRAGALVRPMEGCRYLIHVAALYSFSPELGRTIVETNVRGTASILEAARIAGIERAAVTSSSATVGPARDGTPVTEQSWAQTSAVPSGYHDSKVAAERAALAARVPAVLILPTAPVGSGDWKPTPTGQMVIEFMRGRIFASLGGGLNMVAVQDVAAAHVAALERGEPRERYLVGGENMLLDDLWAQLAGICGRRAPAHHIPYHAALALGWGDRLWNRTQAAAGRSPSPPRIPLEGIHLARHQMWVDDSKARAELGHRPTPAAQALTEAVRWYHDHGYAT
jgi:dihydroflavonol-4-reductase